MPDATQDNLLQQDTGVTKYQEVQTCLFADAVGRGLSQAMVSEMREYVADAEVYEPYKAHSGIPFIYEIMVKDGWNEMISDVGCAWVANPANLERAARHVKRSIPSFAEVQERLVREAHHTGRPFSKKQATDVDDKSYLLRGFCIFSLKAKAQDREWSPHNGFLGIDSTTPQTIVFIALDNLDSQNGFPMKLEAGTDVCMDSRAQLQVPRSGGGRGIFLALNL